MELDEVIRTTVRFVVVRDPETKRRLRDWYLEPWSAYVRGVAEGRVSIGGEKARRAVFPEGVATAATLALGYPARPLARKLSRRPVSELVFAERYGRPLFPTAGRPTA